MLRLVNNFAVETADMKTYEWPRVVLRSFKKTGFAVLKNHEIPKDLIEAAYIQWAEFFKTDDKFKYLSKDGQNGYFPMKSENAKGNPVKDLKEFYHIFYPFENAPSGISALTTQSLGMKLLEIARKILWEAQKEIPKGLSNLQGETLQNMVKDSGSTLLRVLHYPPLSEDAEKGAVRAAAHEDINLITLLVAATQPGLQVQDLSGEWHDVECEPGTIVVNVGDMLQEASGGLFKSTPHRVINPVGENVSRYSMPLFVHPRPESVLSERYTAGQYLEERLKELGLIK